MLMKGLHSKQECLDYLWQYSRFYAECLWQGEMLYGEERGFSSLTVLFNCLENISRAVTNDYNSNSKTVYKKLYTMNLITEKEHNFLNEGKFSIREIRNLYAHANVMAINFLFEKDVKELMWPITEDLTSRRVYEEISDILFNLIIKIVSSKFIEDVKRKFEGPLDDYILKCRLDYKVWTIEELLVLKGYPENYIPDDLDISEEENYRIVDQASDVNMYKFILSQLFHDGKDE